VSKERIATFYPFCLLFQDVPHFQAGKKSAAALADSYLRIVFSAVPLRTTGRSCQTFLRLRFACLLMKKVKVFFEKFCE